MSLFTPREYTTELSPKSIRQIDNKTEAIRKEVDASVVPMIGATDDADGVEGLVPKPTKNDKGKYLKGDGTWGTPSGGGGGGTTDYGDLENKPSINNVTLAGNKSAEDLGLANKNDIPDLTEYAKKTDIPSVPTKVSELQNDSGYITGDYSTTEMVVGHWIDGKTLYQRTFSGTVTELNTDTAIAIGSNIDYAMIINATMKQSDVAVHDLYLANNAMDTYFKVWVNLNGNESNPNEISMRTNQSSWLNQTVYVTLQYTKTTD